MTNPLTLQEILQNFVSNAPNVEGAALVDPDGLPLATAMPDGMDEERTSAMSAAMLSLGEKISRELERGIFDRIFVQGDKGYGVLTSCGQEAVLLTLASDDAKQGLLSLEIEQVIESIQLQGPAPTVNQSLFSRIAAILRG